MARIGPSVLNSRFQLVGIVSTTISDVRYGRYVDGIDSTTRVACVIVLKFSFARHFSKRIKNNIYVCEKACVDLLYLRHVYNLVTAVIEMG
jgi:hypothetical protein